MSEANPLDRLVMFFFPRLKELDCLLHSYLMAVADYRHEPTLERAMIAAEYAQAFNDRRYWWQNPRRVAIWTRT